MTDHTPTPWRLVDYDGNGMWKAEFRLTDGQAARRIDAYVAERTAAIHADHSELAAVEKLCFEKVVRDRDALRAVADAMAEAIKHILKTEAGILEPKWHPLRAAIAAYRALSSGDAK